MKTPRTVRSTSSFGCRVVSAVALVVAALVAACDATQTTTSASGTPLRAMMAAAPTRKGPEGTDAEFARIAATVPGFAGMYFDDDGTLVIRLVDMKQAAAAKAQLGHMASERGGRKGHPASGAQRVEPAVFDFVHLLAWRDSLSDVVGLPGVTAVDVDEQANKIWIGIEVNAVRGAILMGAERHGVPATALDLEVIGRFTPDVTLSDSIRPIPGGVKIPFYNPNGTGGECSLGFNAYVQYVGQAFITASHCSQTIGGANNTLYYNPYGVNSIWMVGTEVFDPLLYAGGNCPSGRLCKLSDAAAALYSTSWDFGHIARPESVCSNGCFGTTTISATRPTFTITGVVNAPLSGETLDKVGFRTGWTDGRLNRSCVDSNFAPDIDGVPVVPNNVTFKCQYSVRAGVNGGDSGAPVFRNYDWPNGDHVLLYGILSGSWGGGTSEFVFSPMQGITSDLGPLTLY